MIFTYSQIFLVFFNFPLVDNKTENLGTTILTLKSLTLHSQKNINVTFY